MTVFYAALIFHVSVIESQNKANKDRLKNLQKARLVFQDNLGLEIRTIFSQTQLVKGIRTLSTLFLLMKVIYVVIIMYLHFCTAGFSFAVYFTWGSCVFRVIIIMFLPWDGYDIFCLLLPLKQNSFRACRASKISYLSWID